MRTPLTSSITKKAGRLGGSRIEDPRNIRVVHESKRLAFGFESGDDCLVSIPSLMTLSATFR